jgi:hypothetical protein
MRKSDGTLDIIGSAMQIGSGIINLIAANQPTPQEKRINKAVRKLRHRNKSEKVIDYVKANFSDYTEEQRDNVYNEIRAIVGRD